jgi:NAD(P)-dependent dehydrogenase (short-subunit alcohol dehydrogenase family)
MIPLGRCGDPRRSAAAAIRANWPAGVRFLLADQAGYITGSVVTVDGGLSMGA